MENSYQIQDPEENLLDDLGVHLVQASTGQRFANFLIDLISFYAFAILLAIFLPTLGAVFFVPILPALIFGLYMSAAEAIFKGKTLGKLITRTRAVQNDGTPLTASNAFARGFSRLVPFESFSALGSPCYPWHDRWSQSYVVDERDSRGI